MRLWIFSSALVFVVWEREGTRDENDHRHSYSYCTCAEINFPEFDWLSDFQWHCMTFFRGWMHNYCLSLKKRALFSPSWSLFKTALSRSKARLRYWSFKPTHACYSSITGLSVASSGNVLMRGGHFELWGMYFLSFTIGYFRVIAQLCL